MESNLLQTARPDPAERARTVLAVTARLEDLDHATQAFLDARPRLLQLAYRTLGSVADTEDVVQEAWLRWQRTDRSAVLSPTAFLATTTTRLALNTATSAKRRHESVADRKQPEPTDPGVGPEEGAERGDSVAYALLVVMQTLTPLERAVYVLREAFDYPYRRIAEILHVSPDYTRQLVVRARRHTAAPPSRPVDATAHRRLVRVFRAAALTGELSQLEVVLAADAAR